eukprot:CAMPEP_0176015970 /NCGR_PEP_ID=MMETSP0120_2-20121206/7609_1 /TAXON_ID=160619 /ORGANISM="Kryptoperidinium foliaceum, Strain CCMP 1326" /LENGTH=88 /DNA_ID=CAMNT_0017348951 /DNA_START=16 /DNA_END=282 /DNA_ORIENTATION=+
MRGRGAHCGESEAPPFNTQALIFLWRLPQFVLAHLPMLASAADDAAEVGRDGPLIPPRSCRSGAATSGPRGASAGVPAQAMSCHRAPA